MFQRERELQFTQTEQYISGDKKYIFEGKNILYTGKNDIILMPEHSNYIVEAQCPGD